MNLVIWNIARGGVKWSFENIKGGVSAKVPHSLHCTFNVGILNPDSPDKVQRSCFVAEISVVQSGEADGYSIVGDGHTSSLTTYGSHHQALAFHLVLTSAAGRHISIGLEKKRKKARIPLLAYLPILPEKAD